MIEDDKCAFTLHSRLSGLIPKDTVFFQCASGLLRDDGGPLPQIVPMDQVVLTRGVDSQRYLERWLLDFDGRREDLILTLYDRKYVYPKFVRDWVLRKAQILEYVDGPTVKLVLKREPHNLLRQLGERENA